MEAIENDEKFITGLSERWKIISLIDTIDNLEATENLDKWLKEQGFDGMEQYLEVTVKIKPRV